MCAGLPIPPPEDTEPEPEPIPPPEDTEPEPEPVSNLSSQIPSSSTPDHTSTSPTDPGSADVVTTTSSIPSANPPSSPPVSSTTSPSEYPDAPFQLGDRVISRCKGAKGKRFSKNRYPGFIEVIHRSGTRRRPDWSFTIEFDDGWEEVVPLVSRKHSGIHNILRSDLPPPSNDTSSDSDDASSDSGDDDEFDFEDEQSATDVTDVGTIPTAAATAASVTSTEPFHVCLSQILFLDEKHVKCKLGRCDRYEWIMCVDPENPKKLLAEKDGGVHQPAEPYTQPKYENEARALFGVMMTQEREGKRMIPFNYTNLRVRSYCLTHAPPPHTHTNTHTCTPMPTCIHVVLHMHSGCRSCQV